MFSFNSLLTSTQLAVTWLDILDIVLVTFVIYYIIIFVRGTRAIAALNGLFILIAVYMIAQAIGLYTLVWLFDNLFSSIFLVIVILFHEDIRQALSTLSLLSFFNKKQAYSDGIIEILSETCFELASKNIGLIIVLEMQVLLGDIAETGVKLDAITSKDLLSTLFTPKTALHDGAVIIDKQGRIMAAGCILPLADIDRQHFGTRHRAAIGITKASDALVIIVSEERGEVTISRHGRLSNALTQTRFERVLQNAIK